MPTLENNIAKLKLRIDHACAENQRDPASVTLLAVSKTRSAATLAQAYQLGLHQFGENYASEAQQKLAELPAEVRRNSEWHFIGPIQSNKTRFIAETFDWVQSLDRLKIAQRLNDQRPASLPPLQCLIQVNISQESQKAGIDAENLPAFAASILQLPHLQLRGLMAIPKAAQRETALATDFAKMADLLRQLQTQCPQADTLSMGMSSDLELAIAHGATMVRVGADLFGPRH